MVAEAPGADEAEAGTPLIGGAGRLLRGAERGERRYGGLIGEAGLDDREISYINVIQCRPPNNVFPTDRDARSYISADDAAVAVNHCLSTYVYPTLKSRPWRRVDLLGEKALRFLTGKREGITAWRGSPLVVPEVSDKPIAVPTIHPAALMRNQELFPAVVNDLRKNNIPPPEYYNLTPTLEEVKAFDATVFSFDIETNYPRSRDITMVGLCDRLYHAIVVPFRGPYVSELRRIFGAAKEVIGHNCVSFDLPYLAEYGVPVRNDVIIWDTMLMQHLLQPDMPHDLTFVGSMFTSKPTWEYDRHSCEELYNARDVDVTFQAYNQLRPQLRLEHLDGVYAKISTPLAKICKLMHDTGVAINTERLSEVREEIKSKMAELEVQLPTELRTATVTVKKRAPAPPGTLSEKTGKPIKYISVPASEEVVPWRSDKVLQNWLYDDLQIPPELNPKTERVTTDKNALDRIARRVRNGTYRVENAADIHKAIEAIRKLRKLNNLETSFCKGEMLQIERQHASFNPHGTSSGRLSSSNPNMQNVPPHARYIYVPSHKDWSIVSIDFSGIENRLTAWYANDTERLARFESIPGFSEHTWACEKFFGIPYAEVEKDNEPPSPYWKAKKIVHGPVTPEHEVLTPSGWIRIDKFTPGTEVAQWAPDGKIVFAAAGKVEREFDGDLVVLTGRAFSGRMTPDHGLPVSTVDPQTGKVYIKKKRADDLPRAASLPICGTVSGKEKISKNSLRFLIAIQADGNITKEGQVRFSLRKQRKILRLQNIAGNRKYTFSVGKSGTAHFYFPKNEVADVLKYLKPNKTFDFSWLLSLTEELRNIFLDELPLWNGCVSNGHTGKQTTYFSCNKQNVEIAQTIAHLTGREALLRICAPSKTRKKETWKVSFNKRKYVSLESLKRATEYYKGKVYCIANSQTGYVLFRHNGKITCQSNTNYGMGARKISLMYDMDEREVKQLLDKWKQAIPKTTEWQGFTSSIAARQGYLANVFGRKRWFWGTSIHTESLSFLPQSTAADIIIRAMIGLMYERIGWPEEKVASIMQVWHPLPWPARLLLQVHDELVFECPNELIPEVVRVCKLVMEQPWPELGGMVLPVNVSVSNKSWAEVEKYTQP